VVDAEPAADAKHDSGSLVPVATGAGLVVLIGGAGGYVAYRRRRTE
jgi:LPXTG-motif cell wall-anchored protein